MRIIQERIDRENYLEVCISPRELELLKEYLIISTPFSVLGEVTNIGIKVDLPQEEYEDYQFNDSGL